jgi:protein involved in sex pheromone biosynthesis
MKRTMKKMLSFGLVAAMSLTMLAGCGNSKDATNDTNVSNGQEKKSRQEMSRLVFWFRMSVVRKH